jgi:phosphatidylglycerol:prolipoprotein diacylglycerol transferase
MLPLVIPYPAIKPVLIQIGPFAIRWYALAYIAGLVLGWRYIVALLRNARLWANAPTGAPPATAADIDDLLLWATLGVVLGGRIGYILFYGLVYFPEHYLENPLRIFAIWQGGMSFHGGLLGVVAALLLFCRARKLDVFSVGDLVAAATPIGLFFGRIANFINGELYGRPSDVPWAMVFPSDPDALPRHPSQLYEALLEGLVLFVVLRVVTHFTKALERPGFVAASFFVGYGVFRVAGELFRAPENPIAGGITMGMLLSLPMWAAAAYLYWHARRAGAAVEPAAAAEPPTPPEEESAAEPS